MISCPLSLFSLTSDLFPSATNGGCFCEEAPVKALKNPLGLFVAKFQQEDYGDVESSVIARLVWNRFGLFRVWGAYCSLAHFYFSYELFVSQERTSLFKSFILFQLCNFSSDSKNTWGEISSVAWWSMW